MHTERPRHAVIPRQRIENARIMIAMGWVSVVGRAVTLASRRSRRDAVLRSLIVLAVACVWACVDAPLLSAAPAQLQRDDDQRDDAASQSQEIPSGQEARSAIVTPITSDITIDGSLQEPVWQTAPKIGELTQRDPRPGESPTERTDVTLLRDANNLYIGVVCYDSEPNRIISTQMARDAVLNNTDDWIEILLDTYHDRRNAFYFATNPSGVLLDGLIFANGQSDNNWDGIWNVRTRRTNQGWTAEFAIPFKSLSFPAGRTVWGFNISRHIQRKLEDDRWSGARLESDFAHVSEAGNITGLQGLTQGVGLEIRPFAGGRWVDNAGAGDGVTGKPGLDMFYNLTPSLKLTASVNTDFGETEVDLRQINLSRSALFFPEKRSFFLEDTGVFAFSNTAALNRLGVPSTGAETIPFFSRQIGLLAGEEVPIDVGLKLTGKVGRTDVGMLDVRTRDVAISPAKNFFVGRVKRNFLQQSYVGTIFTHGRPDSLLSSSTFGTDVRLATSRFLGKPRNLAVNAYGLKSTNEGVSGRDMSYGMSVEYPNDTYHMEFISREIQENFRPGVGFVSRRNIRLLSARARYAPRPKRDILNLQQWWNDVSFNRFTRLDNGLTESWNLDIMAILDLHFRSGDGIHGILYPSFNYERLFAPFQIYPGVFLAPAEYRFTRYKTSVITAAKRRVQGTVRWFTGGYWSGHADELITALTYKLPPHFTVTFNTNQTFARLPEGDFVARILSTQANYSASPFLTFSNLVQYDNLSRNLGWQSRVRWILRPGNDLFFVFGQGWNQDERGGFRFDAEDRKVSTKFQYSFRF